MFTPQPTFVEMCLVFFVADDCNHSFLTYSLFYPENMTSQSEEKNHMTMKTL